MGFWDKLGIGALVVAGGFAVNARWRDAQETKRRRASPLSFEDGLTSQEFADLAGDIATRTPRVVRAKVTGMTVDLLVRSNSGLSTWWAEVDLNDYGRLTGRYWLTSGNDQSTIPEFYAERLKEEVTRRVGHSGSPSPVRGG